MPTSSKMTRPAEPETAARRTPSGDAGAARGAGARCSAVSVRVMTRYVGITAIGSTMNRIDVNVMSANSAGS